MTFELDDDGERMVCAECIGEGFLSAGVMRRCGEAACSFCGEVAPAMAAEAEALDPLEYRATYSALLPSGPSLLALDVGAGSGHDATWLSGIGYEVAAAEPSSGMRTPGMADAEIRNKVFFQRLGI